ncbi:MAG TPA: type II toxin-antitoxin system RelE/ParE family toxin [Chloroflexi bacterium]|nr:type II toxin-antitoxin system RelE/ParE family toxin [Chloroflexota bacterium]
MYEIILTREAQKDYQKLTKNITKRVNQCLDSLRKNPLQYPQAISLKGKLTGFYRWRVGDWRVVYQVNTGEQVVTILQITHRSNVYKTNR